MTSLKTTASVTTKSIKQKQKLGLVVAGLLGCASFPAHADLIDLYNAGLLSNFTEKELSSALASQAVYDQLKAAGCQDNDDPASGILDPQPANCSGGTYLVWRNVREVVDNANVLTLTSQIPTRNQVLPTRYSLRRGTVALLGRALQWCNGEEFASLNSMSTNFLTAQSSGLASRITALRMGSTGFHASNFDIDSDHRVASDQRARGGAAGADWDSDDGGVVDTPWSTWGGFITGSYSRGEKQATSQENQFDFKGPNITAGLDKRLSPNWVAGAVIGYQKQKLDFATIATVEGYSDINGISILPYLLYQSDRWYFNASLGYQNIKFDTHRRVNYGAGAAPASDITITPHNTFDVSSSHARSLSSYDSLGFSFRPTAKFVIEPSLSVDYQNIKMDRFTEQDLNNEGFAFTVDGQTLTSLEAIPALRFQYTFTPGHGVWAPYIDAQWHHQFKSDPRIVNAIYADAQSSLTSAASFAIKTDELDKDYQVYSVGFSAVLHGSTSTDGHAGGGLQVYANYHRFVGMENFSEYSIAAGLRYEF